MKISIGEIINEILPYSINIKSNILSGGVIPHIRANIGDTYTKFYVSIVQNNENNYCLSTFKDNLHGDIYMPTQNPDNPFIKERQFIQEKYNNSQCSNEDNNDVWNNLSFGDVLEKFYKLLFDHKLIIADPSILLKNINDIEIFQNCPRSIEVFKSIFNKYKIDEFNFKNLLVLTKSPTSIVNVNNIKKKNVIKMIKEFSDLGILLNIDNNIVTDINFKKERG